MELEDILTLLERVREIARREDYTFVMYDIAYLEDRHVHIVMTSPDGKVWRSFEVPDLKEKKAGE